MRTATALIMSITFKRAFYVLLLLSLLTIKASAQPKCKVEHYSTEHGLSHEFVTCMLKDQEGFMWFGSWDGINRFDGHTFVSYKSSPGDQSILGSDRIDQIIEDQSNHLWLKAYDQQIYRFNKKTEQFLPLTIYVKPGNRQKVHFKKILAAKDSLVWLESANEGIFCISQTRLNKDNFTQFKKGAAEGYRLPSDTINFFHVDREHQVWIGTPSGLCCLAKSATDKYKNKQQEWNIIGSSNFTAFTEDEQHLYFGTADGYLVTYDKKNKNIFHRKIVANRLNFLFRSYKRDAIYATTSGGEVVSVSLKNQKVAIAKYGHAEALSSIYEDRSGHLWIEPEKLGIIRFEPSQGTFRQFSNKTKSHDVFAGNRFWVFEDNNGFVWVKMKGGGFSYYTEAKGLVDYVFNVPGEINYGSSNIIRHLYYDNSGVLWFTADERGIVKVIFLENDFKQQLLVEPEILKADNEVRGIFTDRKNRIWLGAKNGKVYVYQENKKITDLFENEPTGGLSGVYSILQDRRGNIWLGTKGNGLFKASPVNKEETKYRLTHFQADKNKANSLSGKEIYALMEDRQGRIWVGTFDEGLNLVTEEGGLVKFVHTGNAFKNYPKGAYQKIRHMALDSAGNIWIGTTGGLLVLDADDRHSPVYRYTAYSKIPGDIESLGNNDIQFIYRDSKNRMWLASSGGGLGLAVGNKPFQSLKFKNFTTKDGLPNDYVLSCAEDKLGSLWIATQNGLSKFNPENRVFRSYDSYDGVPKAAFSEAACQRLQDGQIVFGSNRGYLYFDPEHIGRHRTIANIAFTNLQINNKDAGPGINEALLENNINYIQELTLKHNQNIISIDYSILDQRAGNRQAFAYRLKGFDAAWYNDRQQRRVTYTNLPPGDYVFEVKSLSSDLYSNIPNRRLGITILPPPWKTWWAYLLYAIVIGVLLAFIRRYALAMIRLRHKIAVEQKLAALKMSFFTNVSHELRTPLTLIVNPLEQLSKRKKLSPEDTEYVEVARKNANRMVRFINQLLDLRKVQSDKATLRISRVEIVTFVKTISDHFAEAARSKRIQLEIAPEQKELVAWVDAEKLDVVVYNLLSNALKFTPEGKIITILIRSIPEEQSFSIAVCDQGPGVAQEKLEDIFELFHEGDHAAGRALKGSGIGLALSREFVHLHGGIIWAVNNEGGGLAVTLKLKLGPDHYKQEEVSFVDLPKTLPVFEKPIEQQILPQHLHTASTKDQQAPLVLLIEDNEDLRAFIKGQLGEYYRVEVARDGKEGWQKAVDLLPDLIVSDIMMPVMDGIQLLDKVKNDVNTSHIPVVLLSAKYSIESQIEGLKYGADYYITKPFHNEFLIASIDNLLRQRKKLFESLVEKKRSIELSPEPVVVTSKDEIFLKEVIRVVEQDMPDPNLNMESLAEKMHMNQNTFYRKFKSLTSLTPVEFVRDMRLQRAKQYLDAGENNISEVAYEVGFNNPKYFSTCFKEKYHISPSDYLRSKMS